MAHGGAAMQRSYRCAFASLRETIFIASLRETIYVS
jgi:hypothetical protein